MQSYITVQIQMAVAIQLQSSYQYQLIFDQSVGCMHIMFCTNHAEASPISAQFHYIPSI